MAQNEMVASSSSSSTNQLHVPKQEPTDSQCSTNFATSLNYSDDFYNVPQIVVEKRSSWVPPVPAHNNHSHKRETVPSYSQQVAPPPMAHTKNSAAVAVAAAASWGKIFLINFKIILEVLV